MHDRTVLTNKDIYEQWAAQSFRQHHRFWASDVVSKCLHPHARRDQKFAKYFGSNRTSNLRATIFRDYPHGHPNVQNS